MTEAHNKILSIACAALAFSNINVLIVPFSILFISNLIDYMTGLLAAPSRDEDINSYKSLRGIARKVGVWLLVIVAGLMDLFLEYEGARFGLSMPTHFLIASIVIAWLFVNEVISILENLNDMQVSLPPFLLPLAHRIKTQVEDKAEVATNEITKEG